ncbi:HAD family hydrolase [Panacagrimonas sp.]|uniref:histidinol-phosphatase n=1 Tax=Panacagrimonas sp. TaxID=2480088 RepID=UPI003B51ED60
MQLTIFDLDHTLLAGDSDYLWGRFLVERGRVDAAAYEQQNQIFYDQYRNGTLDIREFCRFSFAPLAAHPLPELQRWRAQFVAEKIEPAIAPLAPRLLEKHRARGDHLMIMTATNRFITEPVAALLGVETLIATDPEFVDGRYTGALAGTPNFREGKVLRLQQWLQETGATPTRVRFYSDSHNDLPLLRRADEAIAVDPDDALREEAMRNGWPVISLRGAPADADALAAL